MSEPTSNASAKLDLRTVLGFYARFCVTLGWPVFRNDLERLPGLLRVGVLPGWQRCGECRVKLYDGCLFEEAVVWPSPELVGVCLG